MANISPAALRTGRALERIGRLLRERESEAGLNPAQWEALRFLAVANRFSRSPSAVAAWLATTRGTASQTLMAIERKGLVSRASDPEDRRGVRLDPTEAGMAMLENDPLRRLGASIGRLSPLHAVALGQSLAHVLEDLLGDARRPGFHACAGCRYFAAPNAGDDAGHCAHFAASIEAAEMTLACVAHEAVEDAKR